MEQSGKEEPPLNEIEKYDYFEHIYQKKNDFGAFPKKWNHIKKGGLPLNPNVKYSFRSDLEDMILISN